MGLADFFATAGRGSVVGNVAEAFGGQSGRGSSLNNFIDVEMPAIAESINNATRYEDIVKGGQAFIAKGLKAGMDPAKLDKLLSEHLVGPALRNLGAGEIGKITQQLGPQTTPITPMVAPEGQGQPLAPDTMFAPQTTPGRKPTEADMFKLAEIEGQTGVKPPGNFASMLAAPETIAMHEASRKKSEQALAEEEAKQAAIGGLSRNEIVPGTGISPQTIARVPSLSPFAVQSLPQREGRKNYITRDLGDRVEIVDPDTMEVVRTSQKGATPGSGAAGRGSPLMRDFEKSGGDITDVEGFMEYAARRRQAGAPGGTGGSETVTETADPIRDRKAKLILDQTAQEAGIDKLPPKEQAAAIKKIAADLGYEIEGNPQVGKVNTNFLGLGGDTTVTGITGFKRKPTTKTVTKTPQGGATVPKQGGGLPEGVTVRRVR
jgi:hypothetical protein